MKLPCRSRSAFVRLPPLLAFAVLALLSTGAGFVEDEIQCDHAAAHLEDCCDELSPSPLQCANVDGCGGTHEDPWLTEAESKCVRQIGCNAIRAEGICERVVARVERLRDVQAAAADDDEDVGPPVVAAELPAVCP